MGKELFGLVDEHGDQDHKLKSGEVEDLEMIMEEEEEEDSSSSFDGSSGLGSSSLDSGDDSSSNSSSSSYSQPNGALYDLSELMSNLPIKRGLSKFYQGKSQSFTCLGRVTCLEDLAKKPHTYKARRSKACSKTQRSPYYLTSPKSTISKKSFSSSCLRRKTTTNSPP